MCSSVPTPPYLLCACMDLRRLTCCLLVHLSASSQPTVATGWRDYNKTGVSCLTPSLPCLQGRLRVAEGGCVFRLCAMCACSSINNTLLSPVFSGRTKKKMLSSLPDPRGNCSLVKLPLVKLFADTLFPASADSSSQQDKNTTPQPRQKPPASVQCGRG